MKILKPLFFLLFIPILLNAQYWGEISTEQSFEQSDLYFNSHYLNTFGLFNFKDAAVGMVDDPFLNLYLNPANFADMEDKEMYLYLDFRGDRKESPLINEYVSPWYLYDYYWHPHPDPRYLSTSRREPEPILSLGLLTYPLGETLPNLFFGATYQLIHKEEPFYAMPYWIYNSNYYYDSFGAERSSLDAIPIIDRYAGTDEMINEGHLFSLFLGYKCSDDLKIGFALNGVDHTRDGSYGNTYNDEYGYPNNRDWNSRNYKTRLQEYGHLDYSAGINYNITPKINAGVKVGILSGKADQNYTSVQSYLSQYNIPNESDDWYYNFSNSGANQTWRNEGNSKYISFNFKREIDDNKEIRAYYKYTFSDIDIANNSAIFDTSYYSSQWTSYYDSTTHNYQGTSSISDVRHGSGYRKKYIHEAMINFKWELSESNTVYAGIYANRMENKVLSNEPVISSRISEYYCDSSDDIYDYNYYRRLFEDKRLEWKYNAKKWSLQIPILLHFKLSEYFGLMLGVNRILNSWNISDQTTAYFSKRENNENGEVHTDTNFGERYTQPAERITENFTDVIASFDVNILKSLQIKLSLDPEFEHDFRIAQWWLSFSTSF